MCIIFKFYWGSGELTSGGVGLTFGGLTGNQDYKNNVRFWLTKNIYWFSSRPQNFDPFFNAEYSAEYSAQNAEYSAFGIREKKIRDTPTPGTKLG